MALASEYAAAIVETCEGTDNPAGWTAPTYPTGLEEYVYTVANNSSWSLPDLAVLLTGASINSAGTVLTGSYIRTSSTDAVVSSVLSGIATNSAALSTTIIGNGTFSIALSGRWLAGVSGTLTAQFTDGTTAGDITALTIDGSACTYTDTFASMAATAGSTGTVVLGAAAIANSILNLSGGSIVYTMSDDSTWSSGALLGGLMTANGYYDGTVIASTTTSANYLLSVAAPTSLAVTGTANITVTLSGILVTAATLTTTGTGSFDPATISSSGVVVYTASATGSHTISASGPNLTITNDIIAVTGSGSSLWTAFGACGFWTMTE